MIEMIVRCLGLESRSSHPVVLLTDSTNSKMLAIRIGSSEARAIALALEGAQTERPMTHRLLFNVIKDLGFSIEKIDIGMLNESTYRATAHLYSSDGQLEKQIDCRPSDAIALAVMAKVPIYIGSDMATQIITNESDQDRSERDTADFKEFVQKVNASDFKIEGVSVSLPDDDSLDNSEAA